MFAHDRERLVGLSSAACSSLAAFFPKRFKPRKTYVKKVNKYFGYPVAPTSSDDDVLYIRKMFF